MTSTVRNRNALSKRIGRFLDRERARDQALADLITRMTAHGRLYLYGGILRDIALYGIDEFRSDIDIVYVGGRPSFDIAQGLDVPIERNRFDGLRIRTERWLVDLWEARKTWAFQQGLREYESIESLLDTTITNWESILYRVDGGRLICKDSYFEDLHKGYLDVVFDANPNVLGMYIRLVRTCASKDVHTLSRRAAQIIGEALLTHSFEEMSAYEKVHYSSSYISKETYDYLHQGIQNSEGSLVNLGGKQELLPFDVISDHTTRSVKRKDTDSLSRNKGMA